MANLGIARSRHIKHVNAHVLLADDLSSSIHIRLCAPQFQASDIQAGRKRIVGTPFSEWLASRRFGGTSQETRPHWLESEETVYLHRHLISFDGEIVTREQSFIGDPSRGSYNPPADCPDSEHDGKGKPNRPYLAPGDVRGPAANAHCISFLRHKLQLVRQRARAPKWLEGIVHT